MRFASFLLLLAAVCKAGAVEVSCQEELPRAEGGYEFIEHADEEHNLAGASRFGKIYFTNLDVFNEADPDENNRLYRFLNRIHIETRPDVLKDLLLFDETQAFDYRLLKESERLLRSQKFLYDADIRPVRACDGRVDVEVITRDTWSLTVDASFDRSGGENKYGFGIRETNLLGRGQEVSVKTKHDEDRSSTEFSFKDDNLRGSRIKTRLRYSDNDDGSEGFGLLELPFYSLDARRAWTISLRTGDQVDAQYFRSDDVTEVRHESEDYRVAYGFSRGLVSGMTRRWYIGYWYRTSEFSLSDELLPPAEFPVDRELSFPYVEYSSIEDKYVERVNINQFGRTEDLHVGARFYTRLGYSAESFGGDEDRFVFEGSFRDTLHYSEQHIVNHRLDFSGLRNRDDDEFEDLLLDYTFRYIYSATSHLSYLVDLQAVYSRNLNTHQQVLLGGDTGVRAFETRLQTGDRSVVFNLERRTYTDIHLFNLIRVGWALFIDVGRAWEPGVDTDFEDDVLANVGFGLRLASSKSDVGRFMHIDVAFPLTNRDDPDVDSSLVSVRLVDRF